MTTKFLKDKAAYRRWAKKYYSSGRRTTKRDDSNEPRFFPCFVVLETGEFLYKEDIDKLHAIFALTANNSPI